MNWKARPWHAALSTVTMALALAGLAPEVHALAVGRITVLSALGQPLRAEIDILNIDSDESATLKAGIASADAFRGAGMDYNPLLQNVTVSIVRRSDGRTVLQLASERPVNEPFVDLILETSWATGRILRGYTMLFDPPRIQAQEAGSSTAARSVPALTTPAAAPTAPVAVAPADSQVARKNETGTGGQVTVKPGDSATKIASAHKPANVSLDQMLVALLQANPDAFVRGNLNRLKAGAVLNLPVAEQAGSTAPAEASRIVVAQSQDFGEYRKKLAENVPAAQTAAAQRQASGNVKAQVDEKKGPAPAPDKLTLSKGSTQAKASADAASKDKQAKEAAARVAELAKNISELNKVKGALTAAPVATGTTAAATASSAASAAQPSTMAPTVVAPTPVAPASPVAQANPAAAKTPSPAKPAPAPSPERSLMDQILGNQMVLLAGGGLVALLAALGLMRARRRKSEQAAPAASVLDSRLQPESFFKASGHNVDTNAAAGSSMMYSPSQLDSAGDVDPVAEADVYLAYGRDIQAEEILREAMRLNPTRLAIHAKLLGIFAKRRDLKAFEAVAREAHVLSAGAGPEWEAIAKMGQELDPTNLLFQGDAPAPARTVAMPAFDDSPASNAVPPAPASAVTAAAPVMADLPVASPKADVDLDFDLDISPAPAAPSVPPQAVDSDPVPAAMAPAPAHAAADEGLISFDLDSAPPAPTAAVAPAPEPQAGMIEFDMGGLSLDLDTPAAVPDGSTGSSDDPLATKLALAEEFEAIGDTEGAKLILEEVIAEASGDLKVRAQRALAKLG